VIDVEDTKHMLFNCGRAKEIWRRLGLEDLIIQATTNNRSGQEAFEYLLYENHDTPTVLGQ
jgi:hypothetical protein